MVIVLLAQEAVTPVGNPVGIPIPVAPEVAIVMLVNVVLMHNEGVVDGTPTVLVGFAVMATLDVIADEHTPLVTLAL